MHFENLQYFLALLVIPGLIVLYNYLIGWKKKTGQRIGDPLLVQQLVRSFSKRNFLIKFIIVLLAVGLLITGMANLRAKGADENITRQGVDVMIVLDVSKSMLAQDVKPSRLDKAKQLLYRLIDRLQNDRVGLILFAGRSYMQMPLTTDHSAAKLYISEAGPNAVPTQGTVFAEALNMANSSFNRNEHKYKAIVLISDGEDHDEDALKTADELSQQGVMVCTVGIGSPEGSRIPDSATNDFKRDAMGSIVVSKLNEEELKQIADKTKGIYVNFESSDQTINELMKQLSQVEKKTFTDVSLLNYKTYYLWFTGAMFLLLMVEFILPERKWRVV